MDIGYILLFLFLLLEMALSLVLAIIIEVIFVHFYERLTIKSDLVLVMLINVVTNPIVVTIANSFVLSTNISKWWVQLPLEAIVVIVEWRFYKNYVTRIKRPLKCSILANGISYFLPMLVAFIFSSSFGATTVFANPIMVTTDPFLRNHQDECIFSGDTYSANGEGGQLKLYQSPETPWVVDSIPNGTDFLIHMTYESHGIIWGNVIGEYQGWVNLSWQKLKYSKDMFLNDHKDNYTNYNGEINGYETKSKIVLWTFPHSSDYQVYTDAKEINRYVSRINNNKDTYVFIDEEGNKWVASPEDLRWIYVSDPENTDLANIRYFDRVLFENEQTPPRISWDYIGFMLVVSFITSSIGVHYIKTKVNIHAQQNIQ